MANGSHQPHALLHACHSWRPASKNQSVVLCPVSKGLGWRIAVRSAARRLCELPTPASHPSAGCRRTSSTRRECSGVAGFPGSPWPNRDAMATAFLGSEQPDSAGSVRQPPIQGRSRAMATGSRWNGNSSAVAQPIPSPFRATPQLGTGRPLALVLWPRAGNPLAEHRAASSACRPSPCVGRRGY